MLPQFLSALKVYKFSLPAPIPISHILHLPNTVPTHYVGLKWIEVLCTNKKLYGLVINHIGKNLNADGNSFSVDVVRSVPGSCSSDGCGTEKESEEKVAKKIGLGAFLFKDHNGKMMRAIHQVIGDPVGTDCGVQQFRSLIVFSPESEQQLSDFCRYLVKQSESTKEGFFTCFKWHTRYRYWQEKSNIKARSLDSVILPEATKSILTTDINNFLDPKTKSFYEVHGIPYRRSYLFYGVPGAGKTSLVQALAGAYGRNICFLQPTDPNMTDDCLADAMEDLPSDTIVVLEDIDSLFSKDRKNKDSNSHLTFSGLLNALDGVGSSNGQIIVLTTNLREQLDSALIRNGRVDVQIEFANATPEQFELMWRAFYPVASDRSKEFSCSLQKLIGRDEISTACLQHFFVMHQKNTADEAINDLNWIREDLALKKSESEAEDKEGDSEGKEGKEDTSLSSNTLFHSTLSILLFSLPSIVKMIKDS